MHRHRALAFVALAAAVVAVVLAVGPRARADGATEHRIAFLYVSGKGAQAKAWYDGGPPSGGLVQAALDSFGKLGYRYAAIASSGAATLVSTSAPSPVPEGGPAADYVILLER